MSFRVEFTTVDALENSLAVLEEENWTKDFYSIKSGVEVTQTTSACSSKHNALMNLGLMGATGE